MDTPDETIRRIEELDRAIGRTPEQSALYMRRGRLLYRAGLFHRNSGPHATSRMPFSRQYAHKSRS